MIFFLFAMIFNCGHYSGIQRFNCCWIYFYRPQMVLNISVVFQLKRIKNIATTYAIPHWYTRTHTHTLAMSRFTDSRIREIEFYNLCFMAAGCISFAGTPYSIPPVVKQRFRRYVKTYIINLYSYTYASTRKHRSFAPQYTIMYADCTKLLQRKTNTPSTMLLCAKVHNN